MRKWIGIAIASAFLGVVTLAPLAAVGQEGVKTTKLLFPFMTNQAGFDTAVAISNTTADPFGTTHVDGACTLNFFGGGAPRTINTGAIAAGTTFTSLVSTTVPGFQGYMIAVCNFPLAHGTAFVSDLGARNLLSAYLALVIKEGVRGPAGQD